MRICFPLNFFLFFSNKRNPLSFSKYKPIGGKTNWVGIGFDDSSEVVSVASVTPRAHIQIDGGRHVLRTQYFYKIGEIDLFF